MLIAPPVSIVQSLSPAGGTVGPQSEQAITVSVSAAAALLPGTYVERVFVRSNDPDERVVGVPVVLQVNPAGAPAIPVPVAPGYGETIDGTPVVAWTSTGAAGYDVEVASDERFAAVVYRGEDVAGTSTAVPGLLAGGTYYWHVRSDAGGGSVSTWSAPYVLHDGAGLRRPRTRRWRVP